MLRTRVAPGLSAHCTHAQTAKFSASPLVFRLTPRNPARDSLRLNVPCATSRKLEAVASEYVCMKLCFNSGNRVLCIHHTERSTRPSLSADGSGMPSCGGNKERARVERSG